MREFKIRASAIGHIMTEPRTKSEVLSETCKTYLREWWVSEKYGRRKDFANKFTDKGNAVEEDSITLLSVADGVVYLKNEHHYSDSHITGTPDIVTDNEVIDIKSSWDIFTFHKSKFDRKLDNGYWWQVQGYMALTGKESARVVFCLVDTPEWLINEEKRRYAYRNGDSIDITAGLDEIGRNMTFSDIPPNERIATFYATADTESIAAIRQRVEQCREYLNTLAATEAKDKRKGELTTGA